MSFLVYRVGTVIKCIVLYAGVATVRRCLSWYATVPTTIMRCLFWYAELATVIIRCLSWYDRVATVIIKCLSWYARMVTAIIRCTFSANVSNQAQGDPSLRWAHTYVILQVLPSNLVFSHLTILYYGFKDTMDIWKEE